MSADDAMDVDAAPAPATSLPLHGPAAPPPAPDLAATVRSARQAVVAFLKDRRAVDIVPPHSRVVIVDADLRLKHAFRALLDNGVRAAPVMDLSQQRVCGLLCISDILHALLHLYYTRPSSDVHYNLCLGLGELTVRQWQRSRGDGDGAAAPVRGDAALFDAVRGMRDAHRTHVAVVGGSGALLHTLEHWRVLRYVRRHFCGGKGGAGRLFEVPVGELDVGTYGELVSVKARTTLVATLETLEGRALSAVPVVDDAGGLVEVYSRADTVILADGRCDGVTMQREVGKVLQELRGGVPFRGATCERRDSLGVVFDRFEETGVQRLYVVEDGRVRGVIALSDLVDYFLYG